MWLKIGVYGREWAGKALKYGWWPTVGSWEPGVGDTDYPLVVKRWHDWSHAPTWLVWISLSDGGGAEREIDRQTRASSRVMVADTEQPKASWDMVIRGAPLWVKFWAKEAAKSAEEDIWRGKSESLTSHRWVTRDLTYWKHYMFIRFMLWILPRPSTPPANHISFPFSVLSLILHGWWFKPSRLSTDFPLCHHLPSHSQPSTLPRIKSEFLQFSASWLQTDLLSSFCFPAPCILQWTECLYSPSNSYVETFNHQVDDIRR